MIVYYTEADLVKFGNMLLSKEERMSDYPEVTGADLENFKDIIGG